MTSGKAHMCKEYYTKYTFESKKEEGEYAYMLHQTRCNQILIHTSPCFLNVSLLEAAVTGRT